MSGRNAICPSGWYLLAKRHTYQILHGKHISIVVITREIILANIGTIYYEQNNIKIVGFRITTIDDKI